MGETVEMVGATRVRSLLHGIADRLIAPGALLEAEFDILEQSERDLFGTFAGKYVNSGDLMASLTQRSANGAIRRAHVAGIDFGTSIWYAKFQRRIAGPSGRDRGRRREGPNLVLKLTPPTRTAAAKLVMDRILGRL